MKALVLLSVLAGIAIGALPEILTREPKIIRADEFWRVNGTYTNEGELFEVFYPPLEKTVDGE